ncbi:MAG: hypothetical protein FWD61_06775 [Phycisphaerales bacterium]|nr:hypothetical protein [Phycisphaerales bacterium]
MLDGLDLIDWASLQHAYDSAVDVPDLLRDLASTNEEKRKNAIYRLFGNIWHQGTVYPATAAAVPFLYELLNAPNVSAKSEIACLLACIAAGTGYLEVHICLFEKEIGEGLAEEGKSLKDELEREAAEIRSVHQAASTRLLDLLPYLHDSEAETRRAVAVALGCYPEHLGTTLPTLLKAAETEMDKEVQQALAESIDRLAKTPT